MPIDQVVVAIAGVGGLAGAAVALIKARPERDLISVRVAEGALGVQVTLVDQLEEALKRVQADVTNLTTEVGGLKTELNSVSADLRAVTIERDRLSAENHDLRTRVTQLETEVTRLSNGHSTP